MCIKIVEIYCSGKKISPLVGRRGHGLGRRRIMSNFFLYCVHLVYFLRNSTEFCVNRTEFQRIHFHFLLLIFSSFLQFLNFFPLIDRRLQHSRSLPSALLSNNVEAMVKTARYQEKLLREDAEREAREIAVVVVSPFVDADKSLLAGGHKYRLEKTDPISVILKVDHSGFNTINNNMFGSKFLKRLPTRLQES